MNPRDAGQTNTLRNRRTNQKRNGRKKKVPHAADFKEIQGKGHRPARCGFAKESEGCGSDQHAADYQGNPRTKGRTEPHAANSSRNPRDAAPTLTLLIPHGNSRGMGQTRERHAADSRREFEGYSSRPHAADSHGNPRGKARKQRLKPWLKPLVGCLTKAMAKQLKIK